MSLNIQVTADVAKAGQQIDQFAKSSRIALTNLSLVVQDLPYGFLGIQNNLPYVVKSFQDLSKETGGTANALKSLGSQLIGPGGLFFAFSAVTTGLTYLTQEYGSLSNAANILLGIQKSQKQILQEYNKELDKSTASNQVEISNLESLYKILISTNSTQEQRVGSYKEINKQWPDLLKGLQQEQILNGKVNIELDKRIQLITTQIRLEGQRNAIIKLLDESTTNYVKSLRNAEKQDFFTGLGNTIRGLLSGDLNPFTQRITGLVQSIGSANKETQYWKDELDKINLSLTQVTGDISKFNTSIDNQSNKLKKNTKDLEVYQETYKRLVQYFKPSKIPTITVPNVGGPMANNLASPFLPSEEDLKLYNGYLDDLGKIINDKTSKMANSIKRNIQEPLNDMFDLLLTKGKFSWQAFGQTVIDVLKRVATQAIATGIASLIANILAPGTGVAAASLLKSISTSALGDYLSNVPGQANFGGLNGSLGISGQVVFVQRGSDLVGVLNRTNATINRVG